MPLVLSNLSLSFDGQPPLLNRLHATIESSSRVALIGANGSGKSSLLNIIAAYITPTAGHVTHTFRSIVLVDEPGRDEQSWGEVAFRNLRAAITQEPDLLLLDEPTRHLDYRHRGYLSDWLVRLRHTTLIVVSHDLDFLELVATDTWHLEKGVLSTAKLTPLQYLDQTRNDQAAYGRQYQQQQHQIDRLKEDIRRTREFARRQEETTHDSSARRLAKKVAKKAQSREKRLRHWESSGQMMDAPQVRHQLRLVWDHVPASHGIIARMEDASIGFQDHAPIFSHLFLDIKAGERIGIMGNNGAGKSSLMEALLGEFRGIIAGYLRPLPHFTGYIRQTFDGSPKESVWEYFSRYSSLPVGLGRAYLGAYGFLDQAWQRSTAYLSQGELVKLTIASRCAMGVPCMILDEPDHHLDWPSLRSVAEGLSEYPGTLLVISHQPQFLKDLGIMQLWSVHDGQVDIETW